MWDVRTNGQRREETIIWLEFPYGFERFPETKSVQSDEKRHGDMVLELLNEKEKGKGQIMKKLIAALLLISIGCWIGIHRRVIKAWLTGSEMPAMPANHPKVFCCK